MPIFACRVAGVFGHLRLNSAPDFPRAEFCECSQICLAFLPRVCGRKRKHASDEDRKKGKKREVAGAMWGLEKGKRNDAGDFATTNP